MMAGPPGQTPMQQPGMYQQQQMAPQPGVYQQMPGQAMNGQ
jgi:hypothetical protein